MGLEQTYESGNMTDLANILNNDGSAPSNNLNGDDSVGLDDLTYKNGTSTVLGGSGNPGHKVVGSTMDLEDSGPAPASNNFQQKYTPNSPFSGTTFNADSIGGI